MSEVIAGAVGGLLALAGGFIVQLLVARHARRQRLARLGADFLTEGALFIDYLFYDTRRSDGPRDAHTTAGEAPHLAPAISALSEISLLGGKRVALQAQAVNGHMNRLMLLATPSTSDEDWMEAVMEFGAARLELMHGIRRELGRPRLSDDKLGHDAPDIEDPASTHTPR